VYSSNIYHQKNNYSNLTVEEGKSFGWVTSTKCFVIKKKKIVKCRNYAKFRVCMFLALFRKAQGIDKRTNHKLGKLSCVSKFHSPLIKVNVHTNLGKKNLVMKS